MNEQTENISLPWYRYGMVWVVILLPLTVVIASMVTISIAIDNAPIIVEKNSIDTTDHETTLNTKD